MQLLIIFLLSNFLQSVSTSNFDEEHVYIVARSTKSKAGIIKKFNLTDANFNHIGIGLFQNERFNVYDFSDQNLQAFNVQNLESFITKETTHLKIFAAPINPAQQQIIQNRISLYSNFQFDHDFLLNNNRYYCSEFCFEILNFLFSNSFKPTTIRLSDPFITGYLQREMFEYIPVDFFLASNKFTKIIERSF